MKFIIKIVSACLLTGILLVACKKDGELITAKEGTSGTLSASSTTLTLSKETAEDSVIKFSWQLADFGYAAAVTQTLQIASAGTNFADSVVVSLDPQQTATAFTGSSFNALLSKLNLPFKQSSQVEVRVKSTISSSFAAAYSNTVTMTVTPYAMTSWLYVLGAFQNWVVASPDSLVSLTGNGIYTGIIDFPDSASAFKFTPEKNWNTSYGDGGTGKLSGSGGDIKSPGAGSYRITANLNTLTYTMEKFQYGLVGSAAPGGWSTDTNLKYNNGDSTWSTTVTLTTGAIKFRLNGQWSDPTNYGGSSGTLVKNGADIAVSEAGNYKIILDIPNLKYTLTKQ